MSEMDMDRERIGTAAVSPDSENLPPPRQKDAGVELFFDEGAMTAEVLATAPEGEGAHITRQALDALLASKGVVYGIDEFALADLAMPIYGRRIVVAKGVAAQNGKDGTCTELFPRDVHANRVERQDGSIDYRELGLLRDLKAGTPICTVTPPTAGVEGTNVKGKTIKARDGVKAIPPLGENTVLSENGTQAVTTVDGNLVFRSGRFTVETVYRVQDVNYDVGNITFSRDVNVLGNLSDGFTIVAGGNVVIHGQVGSAYIKGKNITLDKGMNGTGKGTLEAECKVKSGFLENCTVRAGEEIFAQSVINCKLECEGEINVTSGKGVICGGHVMALGNVSAKTVGNEFNTLTMVTLGVTSRLVEERKRLLAQLAEVEKHIEELQKNVFYIEKLVAENRPVPPERVQLLRRAQISLPLSNKKQEQLIQQVEELENRMANVGKVQLVASTIHVPTRVAIGASVANISEVKTSCRVYKNEEGEIVFGKR